MISSHLNRETGIIETRMTGNVILEEITGYIHELKNAEKYPSRMLILTDATHGTFELSDDDNQQIVSIVLQYISSFELIKDAIIISDPRTTAYSILYRKTAARIPNYRFEIFSTREAALNWLLS